MSIFDRKFKLENISYKDKALAVLMSSVHNKLTYDETERIYNILTSNAMSLASDDLRIKEGMKILTEEKADWLTSEEKQNFVSGVWLCECGIDQKNITDVSFINTAEVDYTRKAVLGTLFKKI